MIELIEWDNLKHNDTVYLVANSFSFYHCVKEFAFIGSVPSSSVNYLYFAVYDSSDNKLLMIEKDNSSFFISKEEAYEEAIIRTNHSLYDCNQMINEQLTYLSDKLKSIRG